MAARRYQGQSGRIYEPIEHIGPGGFGAVERVVDEDGNEFALKTLHIGIDPEVLAAEAENLSSVQHRNVVGYVDHGSDPESFLVMELATGGMLTPRARGESISPSRPSPSGPASSWRA
jgi:serine/threonine protein kinase